jgi:hypothetical protein
MVSDVHVVLDGIVARDDLKPTGTVLYSREKSSMEMRP